MGGGGVLGRRCPTAKHSLPERRWNRIGDHPCLSGVCGQPIFDLVSITPFFFLFSLFFPSLYSP